MNYSLITVNKIINVHLVGNLLIKSDIREKLISN